MDDVVYQTRNLDTPLSLETYKSVGGYQALEKILREKISPEDVVEMAPAENASANLSADTDPVENEKGTFDTWWGHQLVSYPTYESYYKNCKDGEALCPRTLIR